MTQATTGGRTYVLVHGAWHGGWVWRDIVGPMTALGHRVTMPTLTGLGERSHLASFDYDLDTHVDDIVRHIEMEDLTDVDLVGWSYGGMVITGVLARIPDRIRSMIYLDAFVPENGKALVDYGSGANRAAVQAACDTNRPVPPIPLSVFAVRDEKVAAFVEPRLVSQAWKCFVQPVKALARVPDRVALTYIRCSAYDPSSFGEFQARLEGDPRWRVLDVPTSHLCMLTDPAGTVAALHGAA